jgi:hypothetical protein
MKHIILICLAAAMLATSCNKTDGGLQFKAVYQLELNGIKKRNAKLNGYMGFENASKKEESTFVSLMADILVDGKDVGTFVYNDDIQIQPASEYKVPLNYSFSSEKLPAKEGDDLTYAIQLKGYAVVKNASGEKQNVPFDHTETVQVKVQKEERQEKRDEKKEEKMSRKELRKKQMEELKLEKIEKK